MRTISKVALLSLLIASAAYPELVDKIAAVVNNEVVTLSEVEERAAPELARIATERNPAARTKLRTQILHQTLDQLIGEKLIEAQIKELNIEVGDPEVEAGIEDVRKQYNLDATQFEELLHREGFTMPRYREFIRKHLAQTKLINLKVRNKVKVSDEDLKAEYAKTAKLDTDDVEVHARHIVVQLPPKASAAQIEAARKKAVAIAEEARRPGVDFIELAKKKSEGPSAADGGDLGFFKRGVMLPEFDRAAFQLKPGEVSDPVKSSFGWHVIKVEERRNPPPKGFEEVKEQLREKLLRAQMERYTAAYIQDLRQNAIIQVKI